MAKESIKKRGIILITVMLLLTVIIMLAALLTTSAKNSLLLGNTYSKNEQAMHAALSGLEYARARIYENPHWMQNDSYSPGEYLKESDKGNFYRLFNDIIFEDESEQVAVGYIGEAGKNSRTKFEIAFSQAGAESRNIHYVSCNNTMSGTDKATRIKNNNGWSDFRTVGKGKIHIISRGICDGIVKYAEGYLDVSIMGDAGSCSIARDDINVNLSGSNPLFLVSYKDGSAIDKKTELRSVNTINISSGIVSNPLCFSLDRQGTAYGSPSVSVNGNQLSEGFNEKYGIDIDTQSGKETEQLLNGAEGITWENVNKNSTGKEIVFRQMPSGAYIYVKNLGDGSGGWKYCDISNITAMDKDAFKALTLNTTVSDNNRNEIFKTPPATTGVSFNGETMTFSSNTNIRTTDSILIGCVDNLSFLSGSSISLSQRSRVNVVFQENEEDASQNPVLSVGSSQSSNSSLYCHGELKGSGKVMSSGSIYMQGGSYFDTAKNSGVSVYAENDVEVIPSTAIDRTEEATKALEDFLCGTNGIWDQFYLDANAEGEKHANGEQEGEWDESAAARYLLDYKNSNDKNLSQVLEELGCKNDDDKLLYAKTIIGGNSILTGSGIESPDYNAVEGRTYGDMQIDALTNNNNLDSNIDIKEKQYDPYYSDYKESETISNSQWQISDPTAKVKLSINYFDDFGFNTIMSDLDMGISQNNIRKNQVFEGSFIEIRINRQNGNGDANPDDLFIYIPTQTCSSGDYSFSKGDYLVRFGLDKHFSVSPPGTYSYEAYLTGKLNVQTRDDGSSVFSLNSSIQQIFNDLESCKYYGNNGSISNDKVSFPYSYTDKFAQMKNALPNFEYFGKGDEYTNPDHFAIKLDGGQLQIDCLAAFPQKIDPESGEPHIKLAGFLDRSFGANDTLIGGMIFTRNGSFKADCQGGSVSVKGGVVAYGKGIDITNANFVNFCYDPDYMGFYYGKEAYATYLFRAVF